MSEKTRAPARNGSDPSMTDYQTSFYGSEAALNYVEKGMEDDFVDDSPYPEVRAAVANTDNEYLPVDTFRAWFIGIIFAVAGSFLNQFFAIRYPGVYLGALAAQLLAYPAGRFLAFILPTTSINIFGVKCSLNPGPFNIKEHTLITVMANVSFGSAYATDILVTQIHYFNQDFGWTFAILLCISTQVIGYGIAGAARRFLVYPASMIWPSNLVNCALFQTLHEEEGSKRASDGSMSRYTFFMIAFFTIFVYEWIPNNFFISLSYFSWVCWIFPNNVVVNQLFGVTHGLGMGVFTFDWGQITTANTSPLMSPWWAEVNVLAGFVLFFWIITPTLYYNNVWHSAYLPIMSTKSFDRFGKPYVAANILNPDVTFNETLYKAYSPLYLPASFALAYMLSFCSLSAVLVHIFLFYRHDIVAHWRQSRVEDDDIHRRLMRKYPEVPDYWYYILFFCALTLSLIVCVAWPTHLPWWGLLICILLPIIYTIPIGIIQAITNIQPGLNVITEFVCGYMLPGRPIANTMFKTYGYISMAQALSFVSDLKIGHYMKIPPRSMFFAQTIACIIAAVVNCSVVLWQLKNIPDVCTEGQINSFNCKPQSTFFTASLVWGAIGPARIFGPNSQYWITLFGFAIGALLPIPGWYLARLYPQSWYKYINWPVIFSGTGSAPPATGINFTMWGLIGFIFQNIIRRRYFNWWAKYNYVLSAALDSGTAFAVFISFFVLTYSSAIAGSDFMTWINGWRMNYIFAETADWAGASYLKLPVNATFGPSSW